jgi:hypothetical protein
MIAGNSELGMRNAEFKEMMEIDLGDERFGDWEIG